MNRCSAHRARSCRCLREATSLTVFARARSTYRRHKRNALLASWTHKSKLQAMLTLALPLRRRANWATHGTRTGSWPDTLSCLRGTIIATQVVREDRSIVQDTTTIEVNNITTYFVFSRRRAGGSESPKKAPPPTLEQDTGWYARLLDTRQ